MKNVFEIIRQKETELYRLQQEVDALKLAASLLAEDGDTVTTGKISQPLMIKTILVDRKVPTHVQAISEEMDRRYHVKLKPDYVSSLIHRYIKRGRLFRKTERPNTFALAEWPMTVGEQQSLLSNGTPVSSLRAPHVVRVD